MRGMPQADTRSQVRQRLADHLPDLAVGTMRQVTLELPYYRGLSVRQVAVDVPDVIERNLALFARLLREERLPQPGEVSFIVRSAARRAEEQIPLPEVLAAYFTGVRWCWKQAVAFIGEDDLASVAEVGELVLTYLQSVTVAVTDAYVEATSALHGRDREARAVLLHRLLEGSAEDEDWTSVNLAPWEECSVLSLRLPRARGADDVARAIESRRRVGALRDAFADLTGTAALDDLGSLGGIVVLRGAVERGPVADLLGRTLRTGWQAGLALADAHTPVPEAASAAHDCAEVAERLHHPSGVHELADLVLEVQVTRPGPARTALGKLLVPLEEHPELLDTLRAYVAAHGRRAEAAERLHVHPNTLDYRLRRVGELTDVDPATRDGGQLLRAAVVVREFLAEAPRCRGEPDRTRRSP